MGNEIGGRGAEVSGGDLWGKAAGQVRHGGGS